MIMLIRSCGLALLGSLGVWMATLPAQDLTAPRTWQAATGNYSVEAEFVELADGSVQLKRADGKAITVPLGKLSKADQLWIRKNLAALRAAAGGSTLASASSSGGDWYRWRGPAGTGISGEQGLRQAWSGDGPPLLWSAGDLGGGHASLTIHNDKIYTLGNKQSVKLLCLNLSDGAIVWETEVGGGGDPNCTPTVDPASGLVFGMTKDGTLLCANAETGEAVWRKSFANDFGGRMMSSWGYSESPLVDGEHLICTPGGDAAVMVALDKTTGRVVWQTPMPGNSAGYASPVISNAGGIKQYVTLTGKGLIGVAADNGRLLWHYARIANTTANCPTPLVSGDLVFGSSGYDDGGTALLRLQANGRNGIRATEVYYKRNNEIQNHHGGMVLIGDHVYLGHGHNNGLPMCVELKTGRIVWGPTRGAGTGSAALVAADGMLYFRYQNGVMALVEATPRGYQLNGQFRIKTRHAESWSHPVIQDQKLYLRDQHELHVYDIAAE